MRVKYLVMLLFFIPAQGCVAEGEKVVDDVIEQYRALSTYHDSGTVDAYVLNGEEKRKIDSKKFTTTYGNFALKFEWTNYKLGLQPQTNSLVTKDDGFLVTLSGHEPSFYKDELKALSSIEGVSGGLAFLVPRFITKDMPCNSKLGAISVKQLPSEFIDGRKYILLNLIYETGKVEKLWVDSESLMLNRVERYMDSPIGKLYTDIRYLSVSID